MSDRASEHEINMADVFAQSKANAAELSSFSQRLVNIEAKLDRSSKTDFGVLAAWAVVLLMICGAIQFAAFREIDSVRSTAIRVDEHLWQSTHDDLQELRQRRMEKQYTSGAIQ